MTNLSIKYLFYMTPFVFKFDLILFCLNVFRCKFEAGTANKHPGINMQANFSTYTIIYKC